VRCHGHRSYWETSLRLGKSRVPPSVPLTRARSKPQLVTVTSRYGQLSPKGFFLGGAGYLLGKEALRRLVNKEVFEWAQPRPSSHRNQRAWSHAHTLSVAREARLTSQAGNCSSSCFLSNVSSAQTYVPLTVRLVDLCRDLMAGEHTCHHRYLYIHSFIPFIPLSADTYVYNLIADQISQLPTLHNYNPFLRLVSLVSYGEPHY